MNCPKGAEAINITDLFKLIYPSQIEHVNIVSGGLADLRINFISLQAHGKSCGLSFEKNNGT